MSSISDGFRDVFLAGVGAMALGAEKSKELIDQLIAKGEITVEQGKQLNAELRHHAVSMTADLRDDVIAAHVASMTALEREEFAAKVARMATEANERDAGGVDVTGVAEVDVSAAANGDAPEAEEPSA